MIKQLNPYKRSVASSLVLILFVGLEGCADQPPAAPIDVYRDAEGTLTVHVDDIDALRIPRWRARRVFSTENSDVVLYEVRDALILPDSSVLVANAGTSEVVHLHPDGTERQRFGGKGEGPGEYHYPMWIAGTESGGALVFDGDLYRLTTLDQKGRIQASVRVDRPPLLRPLQPLLVGVGGGMLATYGQNLSFGRGLRRDTVPFLSIDPQVSRIDTIRTFLGSQESFGRTPAGNAVVPVGFGRELYYANNETMVAIGSSDSLDVWVYSRDGRPVLRVLGPYVSRRVSDEDIQEWRKSVIENAPVTIPVYLDALRAGPVLETYPAFGGLGLDAAGRLWVAEAYRPTSRNRRWVVFSAAGQPVGSLVLPVTFRRIYFPVELLNISSDRLVLLLRDQFGVEFLEVWEFEPE